MINSDNNSNIPHYGSTSNKLDQLLRPYKNKNEFDLNYPISYKPYIGIIDNSTNQSISYSLPFLHEQNSNSNSSNFNKATSKLIRPLIKNSNNKNSNNNGLNLKKNIYNDLEFNEYFDLNNLKQLLSSLINTIASNYIKLLISQPFEIARILLQIGSFDKLPEKKKLKSLKKLDSNNNKIDLSTSELKNNISFDDDDDDNEDEDDDFNDNIHDVHDEDEDDYSDSEFFTREDDLNTPTKRKRSSNTKSIGKSKNSNSTTSPSNSDGKHSRKIQPISLHTIDIISALLSKEGPRGILKALNTSFLMNTLQYTLESWICGLFAGLLNLPDPLFVDLIHSPNMNLSFLLSLFSNFISNILITPFQLIRMKFIITNSNKGIRSFREILWSLPRHFIFSIPKELMAPILITNLIKSVTLHYPNYLITSTLSISKYNSPISYQILSLFSNIVSLFIKLPFETLLNRAQVNYLLTGKSTPKYLQVKEDELCVKFGGYYGYLSSIYYIFLGLRPVDYNDDVVLDIDNEKEMNKGYESVFRGWRIGMIQIVSKFILNLLNNDDDSNSIAGERF